MNDQPIKIRRRGGGYFVIGNRWLDAGYAAKAKPAVAAVYLHLCRWANNDTQESSQSIGMIARKTGFSENVVRRAARTLEAWGVITREDRIKGNGVNVWTINDLLPEAPAYPGETPSESAGVQKVTPSESEPLQKQGPQKVQGHYQPNPYQPNDVKDQPEGARKRATPNRRIPEDFAVSDSGIDWAHNRLGVNDAFIEHETEKFRDYWTAEGKAKRDWQAAWKVWMRKALERAPGGVTRSAPATPPAEQDTDEYWFGKYAKGGGA